MNTFSISFLLRKDKINKDKEAPVFMRVTIDGKRADISIKRSIKLSKWDNGKPKGNSPESASMREYMENWKLKVYELQRKFLDREQPLTAADIKEHFRKKNKGNKSLIELFSYHNENMKELEGKDYSHETVKRYRTTTNHIKNYLRFKYEKDDINLYELNYDFVTGFEQYLKVERINSHNTAVKYVKNLRKVVNLAVKNNWLDKDPFMAYEAKLEDVDRVYLEEEELEAIESKEFSNERITKAKDFFVFCCYTGLAFVDLNNLSDEHIVKGVDKEPWIYIRRNKTGVLSKIPLLQPASDILEKYKPMMKMVDSAKLLPIYSNQKYNNYLKEVADLCGIEKNLTTHVARHTFATLMLSNGVSMETVSAMLGHKKISTTQIYSKVTERKIDKEMRMIKSTLKQKKDNNQ